MKVICLYSASIRVILTATYRRALINGAAAGGTTLAASAQPLIPYFSGSYDQSWTTSHHFSPKVQKVLKSLLENCQAFIKRTEMFFSLLFLPSLPKKKKKTPCCIGSCIFKSALYVELLSKAWPATVTGPRTVECCALPSVTEPEVRWGEWEVKPTCDKEGTAVLNVPARGCVVQPAELPQRMTPRILERHEALVACTTVIINHPSEAAYLSMLELHLRKLCLLRLRNGTCRGRQQFYMFVLMLHVFHFLRFSFSLNDCKTFRAHESKHLWHKYNRTFKMKMFTAKSV